MLEINEKTKYQQRNKRCKEDLNFRNETQTEIRNPIDGFRSQWRRKESVNWKTESI